MRRIRAVLTALLTSCFIALPALALGARQHEVSTSPFAAECGVTSAICDYDGFTTGATPNVNARIATLAARSGSRTSTAVVHLALGSFRAAKEADGFVNLASEARTTHILHGDATGGGHLWPGLPGKSVFPRDWSGARVMHEISDVATDPASRVVGRQGQRTVLEGTRDGVDIRVVTDGQDIITGYPTNLGRNPR